MNEYLKFAKELAEFSEITSDIQSNITPLGITGVSDSVRAHLIFCICEESNRSGLVIARSEAEASELYKDLCFFGGNDKVIRLHSDELMFYDAEAKSRDITSLRISALSRIAENPTDKIIVVSPEALVGITTPPDIWELTIALKVGDETDTEDLAKRLSALGYKNEDMVEGAGQFSIRGGIVDVYPFNAENPLRMELFDTEVDSVRTFDVETQRTIDRAEVFEAGPACEIFINDSVAEKLISTLDSVRENLDVSNERDSRAADILNRDIERLKEGIAFPSIDKYIPYIYDKTPTILDYISDDTVIFADEPSRIDESLSSHEASIAETVLKMYELGIMAEQKQGFSANKKDTLKRLLKHPFVGLSAISHSFSDIKMKNIYPISTRNLGSFAGKPAFLRETLENYRDLKYKTVILAGTPERAKNLSAQLEDDGIACSYQNELEKLPSRGGIVVCGGSIGRGFEYPLIRFALIGNREIFGNEKKRKRKPLYRGKKGDKISDFTTLNPGDYVVHRNHGIALYLGIEQLNVDGVRKDYLKLSYKNSDMLYVPTDQLDMVYRYDKKEGASVRVNSLGGTDWAKTKQRVKAATEEMAKKLTELYAKRATAPGISFKADTEWQKNLEASFPYDETDDQLRSIAEIKSDMESPHPMDRLLCGDVGYGKTEVALRAAFKAVMSGYQVAYLVPTTILASQHFNTFKQRMMEYPVEIRMLSRFSSATSQKETLRELSTGEADIVVGTHKLLGKSVNFAKLGLLIIDEEQRFGVGHKEKIKEMRNNIDVLTLSATPIPRTLHMSLSGIRDMSIINQPPGNRHPVETYVMEYDEAVIREAIEREISRGGQVYYLFNRVDGIYKTANRLAEILPNARVAVVHGRMSEAQTETIMMEVAEGEVDILVCTTIIETGLDIPNVNTIIIENADRLGLSQMYQLRGRVGRSNRLAYAYLTFKRNKQLTEESEKRLLAMKEFTEFGSGFKIAMRDLEIRGTGNLIGAQQHGHMDSVGYEMYCRLLEEAVSEQKGISHRETETQIDLPVSAYIPESYIKDHSRRIGAYKRIAAIDSVDTMYDAYDELEDRYGTVPQTVDNLMRISLIKKYASRLGATDVNGGDDRIIIKFDADSPPDLQNAMVVMNEMPQKLFMTNPNNPKLNYRIKRPTQKDEPKYLNEACDVLERLCPNFSDEID